MVAGVKDFKHDICVGLDGQGQSDNRANKRSGVGKQGNELLGTGGRHPETMPGTTATVKLFFKL